jgi:hypothetical protein
MHVIPLVARVLGPAAGRRLAPAWLVAAMGVGWLSEIIDWGGISAAASALGPGATAGIALACFAAIAAARAAWRPLFHHPGIAFLDRQPVPPRTLALALLPWALVAAAPAGLVALFWAQPLRPLWALSWALAGGAVAAASAARGGRGWALSAAVGLMGAALIGLARAWPLSTLPIATVTLAGTLWALPRLQRAGLGPGGGVQFALPGRPRGPTGALVREDLLTLGRLEPRALLAALAPAPVFAGYLSVPAGNGCCTVEELHGGALVLLSLGAPALAGALGALVRRRGPTLDPPGRPTSPLHRALTLQATAALIAAPIPLGLALVVGAWGRVAALGWALIAGAALVATWRPWRPFNIGAYAGWTLLAAIPAVTAGWAGAGCAVVLGLVGTALTARRLARHRRAPWPQS